MSNSSVKLVQKRSLEFFKILDNSYPTIDLFKEIIIVLNKWIMSSHYFSIKLQCTVTTLLVSK